MTSQVIDTVHCHWFADVMKASAANGFRYDRPVRVVMWLDAFLSVALVVVCVLASPVVATVSMPRSVVFALGLAAIGCAVLLASFGAITAVLLMLRMQAGQYLLPADLRLPLPRPLRPTLTTSARLASGVVDGLYRGGDRLEPRDQLVELFGSE
jgi:hypothetical protein